MFKVNTYYKLLRPEEVKNKFNLSENIDTFVWEMAYPLIDRTSSVSENYFNRSIQTFCRERMNSSIFYCIQPSKWEHYSDDIIERVGFLAGCNKINIFMSDLEPIEFSNLNINLKAETFFKEMTWKI